MSELIDQYKLKTKNIITDLKSFDNYKNDKNIVTRIYDLSHFKTDHEILKELYHIKLKYAIMNNSFEKVYPKINNTIGFKYCKENNMLLVSEQFVDNSDDLIKIQDDYYVQSLIDQNVFDNIRFKKALVKKLIRLFSKYHDIQLGNFSKLTWKDFYLEIRRKVSNISDLTIEDIQNSTLILANTSTLVFSKKINKFKSDVIIDTGYPMWKDTQSCIELIFEVLFTETSTSTSIIKNLKEAKNRVEIENILNNTYLKDLIETSDFICAIVFYVTQNYDPEQKSKHTIYYFGINLDILIDKQFKSIFQFDSLKKSVKNNIQKLYTEELSPLTITYRRGYRRYHNLRDQVNNTKWMVSNFRDYWEMQKIEYSKYLHVIRKISSHYISDFANSNIIYWISNSQQFINYTNFDRLKTPDFVKFCETFNQEKDIHPISLKNFKQFQMGYSEVDQNHVHQNYMVRTKTSCLCNISCDGSKDRLCNCKCKETVSCTCYSPETNTYTCECANAIATTFNIATASNIRTFTYLYYQYGNLIKRPNIEIKLYELLSNVYVKYNKEYIQCFVFIYHMLKMINAINIPDASINPIDIDSIKSYYKQMYKNIFEYRKVCGYKEINYIPPMVDKQPNLLKRTPFNFNCCIIHDEQNKDKWEKENKDKFYDYTRSTENNKKLCNLYITRDLDIPKIGKPVKKIKNKTYFDYMMDNDDIPIYTILSMSDIEVMMFHI